jgi:predicted enzyme related to lactoylglutathione lyase
VAGPRPSVGQIHITVADVDRSVAFYRDVLGLEHLFTVSGQPMAFLDAGGVRLYLGRTEDQRFVSRPTIYYRVEDLDTSWAEITARGAKEISGPQLVHRDGATELWMAFVADPDDIPVGLMQERETGQGDGSRASATPSSTP